MRRIAFLTMEDPGDFAVYDHLLHEPLARRGIAVDEVPWNRPHVDWNSWEQVVIRWPWDYWHHRDAFLAVLDTIDASRAELLNSRDLVRWNIDKTYLRDLESRGITIVPTAWLSRPSGAAIRAAVAACGADEAVIKPTVGAGADRAFRLKPTDSADDFEHVADSYRALDALVQPFLSSVVEHGEYSLFWFDDKYSHAILKTPRCGDFRVQEEHGGQIIGVTPDSDLVEFGQRVLAALDETPLYSRVDIARLPDGRPALMELELIEPSLYFPWDPQSPDRMADAIASRML